MPWSLLGILLAVCALLCTVGFYRFVYFLSIGYGFAVAGGGIAVLIMSFAAPTATPLWIVLIRAALFVAYGMRLSGFLLIREFKNVTFKKTDVAKDTLAKNDEKKMPVFVLAAIWVTVSVLYVAQVSPILIAVFVVSFICSLCMGYLSSQNFAEASMNWIAEGVNIIGQGTLLLGTVLLHKSGLPSLKLSENKTI